MFTRNFERVKEGGLRRAHKPAMSILVDQGELYLCNYLVQHNALSTWAPRSVHFRWVCMHLNGFRCLYQVHSEIFTFLENCDQNIFKTWSGGSLKNHRNSENSSEMKRSRRIHVARYSIFYLTPNSREDIKSWKIKLVFQISKIYGILVSQGCFFPP